MDKPKLQLVDTTFDVAFEAMRDNDEWLLSEGDVEAFLEGLDGSVFETEVADEDILATG